MVGVYISARGDVVYTCDRCTFSRTIPVEMGKQAFWDHYNGMTILEMLGHYQSTHKREVNTEPFPGGG